MDHLLAMISTARRAGQSARKAIPGRRLTPELLDSLPEPSTDLRYELVLDAIGADGTAVRGVLTGPDAYRDTAIMAVEAATRLATDDFKPGALAPAEAFDPTEFLNSLAVHDITWQFTPVR